MRLKDRAETSLRQPGAGAPGRRIVRPGVVVGVGPGCPRVVRASECPSGLSRQGLFSELSSERFFLGAAAGVRGGLLWRLLGLGRRRGFQRFVLWDRAGGSCRARGAMHQPNRPPAGSSPSTRSAGPHRAAHGPRHPHGVELGSGGPSTPPRQGPPHQNRRSARGQSPHREPLAGQPASWGGQGIGFLPAAGARKRLPLELAVVRGRRWLIATR